MAEWARFWLAGCTYQRLDYELAGREMEAIVHADGQFPTLAAHAERMAGVVAGIRFAYPAALGTSFEHCRGSSGRVSMMR